MARPRSPGFDAQRESILAVAARLFARKGYAGTSMNEVARACRMSKPTLYHYYRDKDDLLVQITDGHVSSLVGLCEAVERDHPPGPERLRALIARTLAAYADARNEHRVLTEDVRFLEPRVRSRILDKERRVVACFAQCIAATRPELDAASLTKPLAMLLFGMLNWLFTWLRPNGSLDHATLTPVVIDLFFGGLTAVQPPRPSAQKIARPSRAKSRRAAATAGH